MKQVLLLSSPE